MADLSKMVSEMSLAEKAALCSGLNNDDTKPVLRLGIPSLKMHDGPNGLRRADDTVNQPEFGGYQSVPAICYPSGCALASSWDVKLMERLGNLLGEECQAERLPILLGPAINIKRTPLCGRNFEYYSEDPFLAGKLAAAYIRAIQSQSIGAGLKHFAANNQEMRRQSVNTVIDERTLREIYLTGFEIAVKEGAPWTVMCAYNRLNGEYCCENKWLLSDVLRGEWDFNGFVMSDWGAVNDRVKSLQAGLELEMPASGPENDEKIVQAVVQGELSEEILNTAVERLLRVIDIGVKGQQEGITYDKEVHHQAAREIAAECMVLLKNEGNILPLANKGSLAVLGAFADEARYQGGGAAHVRPTQVDSPIEEIRSFFPQAQYAPGYSMDSDIADAELLEAAVRLAASCECAVVFAGLPDAIESEAFDRTDMKMPDSHVRLIEEVAAVTPKTVVVLMAGAPVEMDWTNKVEAVLHAHLGGQAAGGAIADLLFGKANPSGKLAESYPLNLEHNPAHLNYGINVDDTEYREGIFVGYRYYDTKHLPVRYPFGHGLSYTSFVYSGLSLDKPSITDEQELVVSLRIRNAGERAGKEVVQLYVSDRHSRVHRPDKELKGFCKVELQPGEEKTVTMVLDRRAFAYYHTGLADWHVESGTFTLLVGASSRDIRLTTAVNVTGTTAYLPPVDQNSTVGDLLRHPVRKALLEEMLQTWAPTVYHHYAAPEGRTECSSLEMIHAQYINMPLRGMHLASEGSLSEATLEDYILRMNKVTV